MKKFASFNNRFFFLFISVVFLLYTSSCNGNNADNGNNIIKDIDGNKYKTVVIGEQKWMAKNLRTTRYNDGSKIQTGLSNNEWASTQEGAYAVYPHYGGETENHIDGINSNKEMIEAYGKLYNWYAIDDDRGICPEGFKMPGDEDWRQLENYIKDEYDLHNVQGKDDFQGVGNALKSCRQINSPLENDCHTFEHPLWFPDDKHYGIDKFGFSALPGGNRGFSGKYYSLGSKAIWWSSTSNPNEADWRGIDYDDSSLYSSFFYPKQGGFSVRCFRKIKNDTLQ